MSFDSSSPKESVDFQMYAECAGLCLCASKSICLSVQLCLLLLRCSVLVQQSFDIHSSNGTWLSCSCGGAATEQKSPASLFPVAGLSFSCCQIGCLWHLSGSCSHPCYLDCFALPFAFFALQQSKKLAMRQASKLPVAGRVGIMWLFTSNTNLTNQIHM